MTTSGGTAESFLLKRGAYTEVSYPGAGTTQAFGINSEDFRHDARFLLSDPVKDPQSQSFDEPHAIGMTVTAGINNSDHIVGSYLDGLGDTLGFLCAEAPRCTWKRHRQRSPRAFT
jgi:hypothetical protein